MNSRHAPMPRLLGRRKLIALTAAMVSFLACFVAVAWDMTGLLPLTWFDLVWAYGAVSVGYVGLLSIVLPMGGRAQLAVAGISAAAGFLSWRTGGWWLSVNVLAVVAISVAIACVAHHRTSRQRMRRLASDDELAAATVVGSPVGLRMTVANPWSVAEYKLTALPWSEEDAALVSVPIAPTGLAVDVSDVDGENRWIAVVDGPRAVGPLTDADKLGFGGAIPKGDSGGPIAVGLAMASDPDGYTWVLTYPLLEHWRSEHRDGKDCGH